MEDGLVSEVASEFYSPKRSFDVVMWRPLEEGIDDAIRKSINLEEDDPDGETIQAIQKTKHHAGKPLARCCRFLAKPQRQRLRRLLIAMAKWNPYLGFNEEFATFCAVILAATGRERAAFSVASGMYEQCQLDDFFVGPCPAASKGREFMSGPAEIYAGQEALLERDVEAIKMNILDSWPCVMDAVKTFGQMVRFERLTKAWLKSLLTSSLGAQPLRDFLPLLRRVVRPGPPGREALVATIAAIFGRHQEAFRKASAANDKIAVKEILSALESRIPVDMELLKLVDESLECSWAAAFEESTPWIFLLTLGLGLGIS